jgi:heme exporter protein A
MTDPSARAKPLFRAENLACYRGGRPVFAGLPFSVAAGGALILRGPNGSGKSSLLRLMSGLARPEAGELRWDEVPVRDDPAAHRARIHFIGHLDALKPALGVEEMLEFWASMRGGAPQIGAALAHFDLMRLAPLPCRLLSAGARRRLALARLIASPADLWLLDEPTNGIDAGAEANLLSAIAAHRAQGGMVVIATHADLDLPNAATLSLADFAAKSANEYV